MSLILDARRITEPAVEPISLDEAKLHLRVDGDDENSLIASLIVVARQETERVGWLSICTQTWRLYLSRWPARPVILPRHPIASISSVKWYDSTDTQQTLASPVYALVPEAGTDAQLWLAADQEWPGDSLSTRQYPIVIEYVAGWDVADVPATIKQYMLLLISSMYEQRQSAFVGAGTLTELPFVDGLIDDFRGFRY